MHQGELSRQQQQSGRQAPATPRRLPRARTPLLAGISRLKGSVLLAAAALAALIPADSQSGTFSEAFLDEMNKAAGGQTVTGLVSLSEQLDARQLEAEMSAKGIRTRWRRHEYVVRSARELALRTQPAVLDAISRSMNGRTVAARPYWIANMIVVEAEVPVFEALAHRRDVAIIYADSDIQLREGWEEPEDQLQSQSLTKSGRSLRNNLVAINAEAAWDKGYTGAGRLVCIFDTGAHGGHPAYASRWRGHSPGAEWSHAWHDPYTNSSFPFDAGTHGTHTLGIMVAHPPGEDPIGVAYEAEWMAAGVLIGWSVEKILESYEWVLDPDGNPSTIWDVPDVINNSWGMNLDCDPTFWNAIELVETAGIVNTIAVDNSGPGYASVNSPESRAESHYVNFGVGNLNPHLPGYPINQTSGRGPSPCDSTSIKPDITAPGTQIYSTLPTGYGNRTGTSMACPHVSGGVAILRQVNPSLTVEQIKSVLIDTAQDLGASGPDNAYGWGLLNVGAAVDRVLELYPPAPSPRNLTAAVQNYGIFLSWEPPLDPPYGNSIVLYRLYRAEEDSTYPHDPFATVSPAVTQHLDMDRPEGSYRYVVTAEYASGAESEPSNEAWIYMPDASSSVALTSAKPVLGLRAQPNPFTRHTEIRLSGDLARPTGISVIDLSGRVVRNLAIDQTGTAVIASWDGSDDRGRPLPAGIYYATAQGNGGAWSAERITLLR